jgi:hypothetical protein
MTLSWAMASAASSVTAARRMALPPGAGVAVEAHRRIRAAGGGSVGKMLDHLIAVVRGNRCIALNAWKTVCKASHATMISTSCARSSRRVGRARKYGPGGPR